MQAMPTPSWVILALIVPHAYHGFSLTPNKHAGVFKRKHTHLQWLPAAATTYLPAPIHPRPSLHFPSVTDSPPNNPANPHSQTHMNIEGKGHPWCNFSTITMAHVHNQARGLTQIVPAVMLLSHRWREKGRFVYLKLWSNSQAPYIVFTALLSRGYLQKFASMTGVLSMMII